MEFHRSSFQVATALFIFITIQMITCSLASSPIHNTEDPDIAYIQNSCNNTLYPQLCYKSLSTFSSRIHKSPRLLAQIALSFALSNARSTSTKMKTLAKTRGALKPRENAAMVDCLEELSDAVYELKISLEEMGRIGSHHGPRSNFELVMSDIQTWVSAALTDDDTCMDGFSGNYMNGDIKIIVRGLVLKIAQLTSVGLALVNSYAVS